MHGPQDLGYWSALSASKCRKNFKHLEAGRTYVVRKQFMDFDGSIHKQGERWKFIGYAFLPYDDGLSLFVSLDDSHEWHIRMRWDPEHQGQIVEELEAYVCEDA